MYDFAMSVQALAYKLRLTYIYWQQGTPLWQAFKEA